MHRRQDLEGPLNKLSKTTALKQNTGKWEAKKKLHSNYKLIKQTTVLFLLYNIP